MAGETDDEGLISVEHVECIGACGGAPAVTVNYELIEGMTTEKARELVRWLRAARPEAIVGAECQEFVRRPAELRLGTLRPGCRARSLSRLRPAGHHLDPLRRPGGIGP